MNHSYFTTHESPQTDRQKSLLAKQYYSGFELAHDTYNALSAASDGRIYYVLSSQSLERSGQFYCYDPATDKV